MKKKVISSFLAALMIAGASSISAFATTANGSIVIGSKSYDLAYANDTKNSTEINNAIVSGGAIYVKDFSGNWTNNATGLTVNANSVPGENKAVVMVTVKAQSFGATVNATSTQEGATQYQIFNGATKLTVIANLGSSTTMFPPKVVGDTVIIKLFNASGAIVATTNVTLVAIGSNVTTPVVDITTPVTETNISLNKTTDSLLVDGTDTLIATINSTNKAVKWTSSANNIATVDNNGKVTAVSEGTATITVTTEDGKTASCNITINNIQNNTVKYFPQLSDVPQPVNVNYYKTTLSGGKIITYYYLPTLKSDFIKTYCALLNDNGWNYYKGGTYSSGSSYIAYSKGNDLISLSVIGKDFVIMGTIH
ncbi:Ig-like domain-containing protein [Clostridium estertheticum]|uniref:Ig-like domain-containing protein n=1 Tax=Clostridium estertheticum TaxID=238834 RepID=UPI00124E547E|nr:Ig-like domain-containing protein [Clostridium estertheticum]MBZ9616765.1 Ig-like domain-containing protein [Clostridium estertheticum subsp. laramiense]WAG72472.1 Ig-like domain-containing protein [Clostridium estertheticum]